MKKLILIFCISFLCFSCSNDDDSTKIYKSEGAIVGFDLTLCACCGGYIIEIDAVSYRLLDDFPPNSNLDLENLPLKIKLDWELISEGCGNFITISAIEVVG